MASKNKDYGSIESLKTRRAQMYARCVGGGTLTGLIIALLTIWLVEGPGHSFSRYFFTVVSLCVFCAGMGYLLYITTRGILPSQRFLSREMRATGDELDISDYAATSLITKGLGILSITALCIFIVGIGILQRNEIIESVMGVQPYLAHLTFALGLGATTLGLHQLLVVFRIRKAGIYEPEGDEIFVQLTRLITIVFAVLGLLASRVFSAYFKPIVPGALIAFIAGMIAGVLVMAGPTILIIETERLEEEETLSGMQVITLGAVLPVAILLGVLYTLYKGAV